MVYPQEVMGIGSYIGELRQGPDGQLYQWVEGIDGFGNPFGFWKALKSVGRFVGRGLRAVTRLPGIRQLLPAAAGIIPGAGAVVSAAQQAGVLGLGQAEPDVGSFVGEIRQAPDGQLYQWVEGIDGFGNPFGFWKAIKAVGRFVGRGLRAVTRLPGVRQLLPVAAGLIPGVGPVAAAGITAAQRAGVLGLDPSGNPIY
ncbi:MAG: hypothetical protein ONB46_10650 [candidate division KSB1 bacterium]|nr:hypothetical protein [candidate division KSB1 bacterium]MDZ7366264.1 hypothetical protein [candidate division KSB1 bacterium]MDZ7404482.1 hypothetical protein [candidate division KSB1 bacterium]